MTDVASLSEVRARIDALDAQIQTLIVERARCALDVATAKKASGEVVQDYYRPEREADVLRKVKARDCGPMEDRAMARIFREIMSACLALQQPLKIAFLGPSGTFTEAATYKQFGHANIVVPVPSIDAVFREVESGNANYGVVPVENTTEGMVNHTLDGFLNSSVKIVGEVELRIHQCLSSNCESMDQIKRIYSHHQSFAQTRGWLDTTLPNVERMVVSSNAEAARIAAQEPGAAALGPQAAAAIYKLTVLATNVEDDPNNTTRFLVIGTQTPKSSGKDKTSLLITAQNKPGGLYHVLAPLAAKEISMTRIESRPSRRGIWDYVFFVDILGHVDDPQIAEALEELKSRTTLFKILGSFPLAEL
jgi:chorismate mutase / prephenate dehydratase